MDKVKLWYTNNVFHRGNFMWETYMVLKKCLSVGMDKFQEMKKL